MNTAPISQIKLRTNASYFAFILILSLSIWLGLGKQTVRAQAPAASFKIVPLGVKGGLDESNLSAYLLAPANSQQYICLDAGTLHHGINQAIARRVFTVPGEVVLKRYLKAYFISHAHLDHVAGLVLNSPDDAAKPIYALPAVLDNFKKNYFDWESWPNFGNAGEKPLLGKYSYRTLPTAQEIPIDSTDLSVRAFPLSHGNYQSTAFLVRHQAVYVLYLGDTGPDEIEKSTQLAVVWEYIAPLVKAGSLKTILAEVSYANEQPDNRLFGHLTPNWLLHELAALSKLTGPGALQNFPVIITHLKPGAGIEAKIKQQLNSNNKLRLKLIFPEQGRLLTF